MSKKRFTETAKWEDSWFMELTPTEKLFYLYILDRCNNCGVWEVNFRLAEFMIGLPLNQTEILERFKNRIKLLENGKKWLIPKFIQFQYGQLNPKCKPHLAVIKLLEKHNLLTVFKDLVKGYDTLKEEEEEIVIYKEIEKDKKKEINKRDIKILNSKIDLLGEIAENNKKAFNNL
tara:strand:- start:1845 stop:2369 length:525 start_codon:yes stop_codon:yes gene_type:complete